MNYEREESDIEEFRYSLPQQEITELELESTTIKEAARILGDTDVATLENRATSTDSITPESQNATPNSENDDGIRRSLPIDEARENVLNGNASDLMVQNIYVFLVILLD